MSFADALPHGPITQVTEGVYAVRSCFRMGPGVVISRTMTLVQTGDGLVVLNAARLSDAGHAELEGLGTVKHLVKLSESHGLDEPYFVDRYRPEVWTVEGARVRGHSGARSLSSPGPVPGGIVAAFAGTSGWRECAYWIPNGGGTLIACDALQHHVDTEGASTLARIITPLMGFKGGVIVASMWCKGQKLSGDAVRRAFEPTLALRYENLVTGHGPAIVGGADAQVRHAIERATR